ncbi:MAG: glutathione peroxidase [bacterium]
MGIKLIITSCFIIGIAASVATVQATKKIKLPSPPQFFQDISINDINGKPFDFDQCKGKLILMVNVASKCGFTSQYKDLQAIYERYKDKGFLVIGIPSNDFANQEPGTAQEIKTFCQLNYQVTFPLLEKIHVKGTNKHPLYQKLTNKKDNPSFHEPIRWNFTKFLIDREGRIVARFGSMTKPDSKKVTQKIEALLNQVYRP